MYIYTCFLVGRWDWWDGHICDIEFCCWWRRLAKLGLPVCQDHHLLQGKSSVNGTCFISLYTHMYIHVYVYIYIYMVHLIYIYSITGGLLFFWFPHTHVEPTVVGVCVILIWLYMDLRDLDLVSLPVEQRTKTISWSCCYFDTVAVLKVLDLVGWPSPTKNPAEIENWDEISI